MAVPTEPAFDDYAVAMNLAALAVCDPDQTERANKFVDLVEESFRTRRFVLCLAMSFLALAERALAIVDEDSITDVLARFDHEEQTPDGRLVNTLNLVVDNQIVRLRPLYNAIEHVIRGDLRRYDFPHNPAHATQAWSQHEELLGLAFAMTTAERRAVADALWLKVLAFAEFKRRSTADALPRPFETVLSGFANTQQGEPPGAVLQGLAFAYYRADSPNVTIETGKVGAGSRRTGRIGDVDGWSGDELVLSIEVKDENLTDPGDNTLDGFLANLAEWPDATAIVVAREASHAVVETLGEQDVKVLTRPLMLEAVERWDLNKQLIAAREFLYYLSRVERHSGLVTRLLDFASERDIPL